MQLNKFIEIRNYMDKGRGVIYEKESSSQYNKSY